MRSAERNQAYVLVGCSLFLLAVSVTLEMIGSSWTESAKTLQPDSDFESLGEVCQILHIDHTTDFHRSRRRLRLGNFHEQRELASSSNKKRWCYDLFTYSFTIRNEREVYTTIKGVDKQTKPGARVNVRCNKIKGKATPIYSNGSFVECWKPAKDLGEEMFQLYNCGNPSCLKIYSPDEAKATLLDTAAIFQYVSWALIAVCICVAVAAGFLYTKAIRIEKGQVQPPPPNFIDSQSQAQHQTPQQPIVLAELQQGVVVAQQQAAQPVVVGSAISQPQLNAAHPVHVYSIQPVALEPIAVPKP